MLQNEIYKNQRKIYFSTNLCEVLISRINSFSILDEIIESANCIYKVFVNHNKFKLSLTCVQTL